MKIKPIMWASVSASNEGEVAGVLRYLIHSASLDLIGKDAQRGGNIGANDKYANRGGGGKREL